MEELRNLCLFADNDCWQRIDAYSSAAKYNSSPRHIFNQIRNTLKRQRVKEYEFVDFCNLDLNLLEQICDLLLRHRLNIRWSARAIVNPAMQERTFRKMRQAGCGKLVFEIITASDKLLKKMGLPFNTEDISSALRLAHQSGIAVGVNLILGFPLETDEDYSRTIAFLSRHSPVIDEIAKITYCLSNYSRQQAAAFRFAFCRYWKQCLSLDTNGNPGVLSKDYKAYLSGVSKLGIPIASTEPSPYLLDHIAGLIEPYSLKREELSFVFDNGKGRLFWGNKELTKRLGLYTSIFSSGFWQDSEHAHWQITKPNKEKMVLKGRWQALPIVQIWEIELKGDASITWRIEMQALEDIAIEGEQQANLMLSDEYETWISEDGMRGSFGSSFNEQWVTLFSKQTDKVKSIAMHNSPKGLPCIAFKNHSPDKDYYLSVLNTSADFSARKLKCHRMKSPAQRYAPGKYAYFEGEIKIIP